MDLLHAGGDHPSPRQAGDVCHLTSAHQISDVRIFHKECRSLAAEGFQVTLVGNGHEGDLLDGVTRVALGSRPGRRLRRMTATTLRACRYAKSTKARLYHLHDPELLPLVPLLRRGGAKVIYDAHESLALQVRSKSWIPSALRPSAAAFAAGLERYAGLTCDAIVAATPTIADRYPQRRVTVVRNYPRLAEFAPLANHMTPRRPHIAYVGGISAGRGILEAVQAIGMVQADAAQLVVAGTFSDPALEKMCLALPGWQRVQFLGWLSRSAVVDVVGSACAGIVTLHPEPNYVESLPIKMFEYMAAGTPVIASDFPLWRQIIEEAGCGLLVDPKNPRSIAAAIERMIGHPEEAAAMGRRGREAVLTRYNWEVEAEKLVALYRNLLV